MVSKTELLYERYLLSLSNVKTHIGETIWQVYVTSELKIELFCFFTIGTMVWIFIAVKNRYLIFLAVLKFTTTQNEPKIAERN